MKEHFMEAFLNQARKNPDHTAVLDSQGSYSYEELNLRSAYLAEKLLEVTSAEGRNPGEGEGSGKEKSPGDTFSRRVALLVPRTKEFVVSWLAILRGGCAVVTLDSEYPPERIETIVTDASCAACITTKSLAAKMVKTVPILLLEEVFAPWGNKAAAPMLGEAEADVPARRSDKATAPAHNCAPAPKDPWLNLSDPDIEGMLFYTSGSTGKPKGVVHRQQILDAYPDVLPAWISLSEKTRTLCIAMFTFAASLIDLTPPLYFGGSLYIANEIERKNIDQLYEIMRRERISGIFMPPSMYAIMRRFYGPLPLEYLFTSGEKARKEHMFGDQGIFELYGSSESPPMLINPLGKGGQNCLGVTFDVATSFLEDEEGKPITEPGVIGEFCISSPYLAKGYHHMPEETAKKFVPLPEDPSRVVFHTGDYMALDEEGQMIFHGRKDRMIKIRGQRVELGEIEQVVAKADGIGETGTVDVQYQNAQRIVCYYTGKEYSPRELKTFVRQFLAEYMVPDYFIHLAALPRNERNKIDYPALKARPIGIKDLLAPEAPSLDTTTERPLTSIEETILDAFTKTLSLPAVGLDEDFFEIGGNSLLAMELLIQLESLKLSTRDVYSLKTVRKLAQAAEERQIEASCLQEEEMRSYPLLPYQRHYVDYQLYTPLGDGPNVPVVKAIPLSEASVEEVKAALEAVLHHFKIFGMVFTFEDDFVERYEPERIQPVKVIATTEAAFHAEIVPHLLKPHRVINSLLYRCCLYVTETTVYLFMDFHHSIIDGTGQAMVMKNIAKALRGEELDQDRYPEYLRRYALSMKETKNTDKMMEFEGRYNLPDFDRMPRQDHESRENRIRIVTQPFGYSHSQVMEAIRERGLTLAMLFTAAGLMALREFNETDKVQVQWIYHGRDEKWKEDLVGITMSALPVAVDFGDPKLDLMREVRSQVAENIAYSDLSYAIYESSPNYQETINMICEDGIEVNTEITPGTTEIRLWDYRETSPATVECVLYPSLMDDRLLMFINYNCCCYEEASMERFGKLVEEHLRKLAFGK